MGLEFPDAIFYIMRWKRYRNHDEMNSKYNQPTSDGKKGGRKRRREEGKSAMPTEVTEVSGWKNTW